MPLFRTLLADPDPAVGTWQINGMNSANFSAFLWDYGLPDSPEGMRELLQPS